jgi:hypothetical protein
VGAVVQLASTLGVPVIAEVADLELTPGRLAQLAAR